MGSTTSITRRHLVLGAIASGIAVPSVRAQPRPERPRLAIAVGGKAGLQWLALVVAEELGYFRAEGLDVDLADHETPLRALAALQAGTVDLLAGGFDAAIAQQARGQYLESIVLQGRAPQVAMGVSLRTLAHYGGPADLRGRRVGISPSGTWGGMVAAQLLGRGGVRPAEVQYVPLAGPAAALAALRGGQVDAVSHTDPVMTLLEQRSEVKIIGDTRTIKGTLDVFGGTVPAACLCAPAEFVQRHPATCQALAHAVVHALKWLQTAGPSDIMKTVPESYMQGDRALYIAAFAKVREAYSPDGLLPEEGARTALRALAGWDPVLRPERIALSRTYTNEFARRAKERYKA
jgi:NitT/TauT family transport system substrate-binding protein